MDRWYGTDELRRSWCLLAIDVDSRGPDVYIKSCEMGEGNADQFIESEVFTAKNPDKEPELLQMLGTKLDERRYSGVTLITPTKRTIATLRTRFLECEQIRQPTLRGFRHIAIADVLTSYFNEEWTNLFSDLTDEFRNSGGEVSTEGRLSETTEISVKRLWEARTAIGPLVPPDSLQGTPL